MTTDPAGTLRAAAERLDLRAKLSDRVSPAMGHEDRAVAALLRAIEGYDFNAATWDPIEAAALAVARAVGGEKP